MNVAYINPFITATRHLFDTMLHVPLMLGKPYLRDRDDPRYGNFVVMNLGGAAAGMIVLALSDPVALALASALAGAPKAKVDADCMDALGEISNMIAGNAKKDLPGGLVKLSTPEVLQSPKHATFPRGLPVIAIPCETNTGRFLMQVALRCTPPADKA